MKAVRRSVVVGLSVGAVGVAGVAPAEAAPNYPIGNVGTALVNYVTSPGAVPGANDWDCKPSRKHPYPVVLVPGTGFNIGANFTVLAPTLANAGYCVYAFNYGFSQVSFERASGFARHEGSAETMRVFVDRVLASTGAEKVDVVGHSLGGMMPHYYLKRLGGAPKVRTLVGMAPSNHGTDLNGLVNLGKALHLLGFVKKTFEVVGLPGLEQQEVGSDFQKALFGDGDTVAGPRYVVLATKHDRVVTPYTNGFLKGPKVTNILLQDQCPGSYVGHMGLFNDSPTMENILNQLGPNVPGFKPRCAGYGLPF